MFCEQNGVHLLMLHNLGSGDGFGKIPGRKAHVKLLLTVVKYPGIVTRSLATNFHYYFVLAART